VNNVASLQTKTKGLGQIRGPMGTMYYIHSCWQLAICMGVSYVIVRGLLGTAYDVVTWLLKLILVSTQ